MGYLGYQKPQILGGKIYDGNKSLGTNGQVLSTNGSTGVSWATLGNGTLSLGVAGQGITFTGSSTFTANQTSNTSFTVTLNAQSTNTADALVIRDGLGDFAARNITATFFNGVVDRTNKLVISSTNTSSFQYITFVGSTSGNLVPYVDTNLTYNPSLNVLYAGTFSGNLSGNVTGTASQADTLKVTVNGNLNVNYSVPFISGGTYKTFEYDQSQFYYNPSTNTLYTTLNGNVTGNLTGEASRSEQQNVYGTSTNSNYLVTFSLGTGAQNIYCDNQTSGGTNLTYNPYTNTLLSQNINSTNIFATSISATGFSGPLTGNVTGIASKATQVYTVPSSNNQSYYLPFFSTSGSGAYVDLLYDTTSLSYNPSTNTLYVSNIYATTNGVHYGNVTGNVTGNASSASSVYINASVTYRDYYIPFTDDTTTGNKVLYNDSGNNLKYHPSLDRLTAGTFVGAHQGTVFITANSDNNYFYFPFVSGTSSDRTLYSDTGLSYNPSSNNMVIQGEVNASGGFIGNLSGTASIASRALTIDQNYTTAAVNYSVLFGDQNSGISKTVFVNNSKLYFNASTGRLTATEFAGDLIGNVTSSNTVYSSVTTINQQRYFAFHGPGTQDGIKNLEFNTNLYCNPSQSAIYATNFYGRATVANDADRSDTSYVTTATNSQVYYLAMVAGSGDQEIRRSDNLFFNPNTRRLDISNFGTLVCDTFEGDLSGNADTTTQPYVTQSNSNVNTYFVGQRTSGVSGYQDLYTYNTIYANLFTGSFYANTFYGSFVGNASTASQVNVTTTGAVQDFYINFTSGATNNNQIYADSGLRYDPGNDRIKIQKALVSSELVVGNVVHDTNNDISGVRYLTATEFRGDCTGNAATASKISLATFTNNNANAFIPFSNGDSGNQFLYTDNTFYYNSNSDRLYVTNITASTFTGNLTGNVTGNVTGNAGSANAVTFSEISTDATYYVAFSDVSSGQSDVNVNTTQLTFNPGLGNLVVGGTITTNSDRKLKTNIETLDGGLNKVLSMRGVRYLRKDTNETQIGVIAQEVEEVIPEVVYGDDVKSVSYGNIVAVLIEAIKEQNKRIDELEFILAGGR